MEAARGQLKEDEGLKILSASNLRKVLAGRGVKLTLNQTKQLLEEEAPAQQEARALTRVKRKTRRFYRITAPPLSFQIDVIMHKGGNPVANQGNNQMLIIIDILSRKAWVYPMKNHTMDTILVNFKKFEKDLDPLRPVFIQADDGFNKKAFKDYLASKDIALTTNVADKDHIAGGDALGIIDRFVRTLKRNLLIARKKPDNSLDPRWVHFIPDVVRVYNLTPHAAHASAGDLSPDQVFADFDEQIAKRVDDVYFNWTIKQAKGASQDAIRVGDWVRVLQPRGKFTKGEARLYTERYKVVGTRGLDRYFIEDEDGNRMKRAYKGAELVKSPQGGHGLWPRRRRRCQQPTRTPVPSDAPRPAPPAEDVEERRETNKQRFKRATKLPQEPATEQQLEAPRQTRLRTGTIARRTWNKRDV